MLLESIELDNILSFRQTTLKLGKLNVLVGPNGAGKSNLISCLGLLQATTGNFAAVIARGGGAAEWEWKGSPGASQALRIAARFLPPQQQALRYEIQLVTAGPFLQIYHEGLFQEKGGDSPGYLTLFNREGQHAHLGSGFPPELRREIVDVPGPGTSLLERLRLPFDPTLLSQVIRWVSGIAIYPELQTGPGSPVREPKADAYATDRLDPSGANLAIILQEFDFRGLLPRVRHYLRELLESFEELKFRPEGRTLQVYLQEQGLSRPVPAARLSDGTLRFLCLLAILLHPEPPPLVCIEEPELGFHPDAHRLLAELLVEASEHMQIIVTTHSEELVDALTATPEAVVICESGPNRATSFRRANREGLSDWLEHYSLGELWRTGEMGGNRW